jgi:hypothetical protein
MAAIPTVDRRIEKYLTNFAFSYKQGSWVGDFVAPPFKVAKSSDKYLVWTKNDFRVVNDKIKGRELAKEIELKTDEATYTCEEYSSAAFISNRDLRNMEGVGTIRLKEDTTKQLKLTHMTAREYRILSIAGNSSVVTQTADKAGAWATASSGTPVADMVTGMTTIEGSIGEPANRVIMPYDVAMKMSVTDEWRDYFKYNNSGFQNIRQVVDALRNIGLEPMITGARGLSTNEGGASDPEWERMFDQKVLLFRCEPNPTPRTNTFMYSPYTVYQQVESMYLGRERGTEYTIYSEIDELMVNAEAGYLLTDVI